MPESQAFTLELEQIEGFEFRVRFDWPGNAELLLDAEGRTVHGG